MSTIFITDAEIFSRRLKTLRNGRKKVEFAAFIGTSPQNYGRYESGRVPDTVTVADIANRCGVTVDWLLGRDGFDQKKVTSPQGAVKLEKGQELEKGELHHRGAVKFEKGQELEKGELHHRGAVKFEKGHGQGECRYPEGCDLAGDLSAVRERLAGVEGDLAYMRTQLDTVVGLLGHALGDSMDKTRTREGEKRKAG
jgi:transcriptional regulator with XRE-family HTH domain